MNCRDSPREKRRRRTERRTQQSTHLYMRGVGGEEPWSSLTVEEGVVCGAGWISNALMAVVFIYSRLTPIVITLSLISAELLLPFTTS